MMARFLLVTVLSLFSVASAFQVGKIPPSRPTTTSTALNLMSPLETQAIMKQATECAEGECSVDQVDDLISVLQGQQKELVTRLEDMRSMIKSLEKVNASSKRSPDEIRETVRAIYRIFQLGDKASGNDYPALSKPTGWSGEVGKGPTTAYDALKPKKYSP